MIRTLGLAALSLALGAGLCHAGPVTFIDRAPADPATITVSVDQGQLARVLPSGDLTDLIEAGRQLFGTKFTTADGAGRPLATQAQIPTHFKHRREQMFQRASGPDSNACSSCHNIPSWGGAGDFVANAFTSGGTESADFDTVDGQFSNERNTNHMFGSGLQELLAREMTLELQGARDEAAAKARQEGQPVKIALTSKGVDFGKMTISPDGLVDASEVEGVDPDLVIRPFSQKGVFVSLRSFTVTVLNAHHGMQPEERFGPAMTGEADFDGDGVTDEITPGQVSALVAFQAALPAPVAVGFENADWQAMADAGATVFTAAGCSACHMATLPLHSLSFSDPSPFDSAGTLSARDVPTPAVYDLSQLDWVKALPRDANGDVLVPLFGDLKRHVISDDQVPHYGDELMGQGFVPRSSFMTAELWGVADTAPYGHRGDLTTLDEAIAAHGGEARVSQKAYLALSDTDRDNLITYLKTLRMPQ